MAFILQLEYFLNGALQPNELLGLSIICAIKFAIPMKNQTIKTLVGMKKLNS